MRRAVVPIVLLVPTLALAADAAPKTPPALGQDKKTLAVGDSGYVSSVLVSRIEDDTTARVSYTWVVKTDNSSVTIARSLRLSGWPTKDMKPWEVFDLRDTVRVTEVLKDGRDEIYVVKKHTSTPARK